MMRTGTGTDYFLFSNLNKSAKICCFPCVRENIQLRFNKKKMTNYIYQHYFIELVLFNLNML